MIYPALTNGDPILQHLPQEQQTYDVILTAIKADSKNIWFVKNRTPELWAVAVKTDPFIIKSMREEDLTVELSLIAVKLVGHLVEFVKHRTPEICIAAVRQYGSAIQFLSASERTPIVCKEAVIQNPWVMFLLSDEERTLELYKLAMNRNKRFDKWILCDYRESLLKELLDD